MSVQRVIAGGRDGHVMSQVIAKRESGVICCSMHHCIVLNGCRRGKWWAGGGTEYARAVSLRQRGHGSVGTWRRRHVTVSLRHVGDAAGEPPRQSGTWLWEVEVVKEGGVWVWQLKGGWSGWVEQKEPAPCL